MDRLHGTENTPTIQMETQKITNSSKARSSWVRELDEESAKTK